MKKMQRINSKLFLLLVAAIVVLCAGFLIVGCGSTSGKMKIADSEKGAYAHDGSDCPNTACSVVFDSSSFELAKYNIEAKEVTMEAWINPKDTSAANVFKRSDGSRGISLSVAQVVSPAPTSTVTLHPTFSIQRVPIIGGTSSGTVEYTIQSSSAISINAWHHVAGILTNQIHGVDVHAACSDAESEDWHIDIYVDGVFEGCATTKGGTDETLGVNAYAHNPADDALTVNFNGSVDETRIWTEARTLAQLTECKGQELGNNSGTCGRVNDSLITYMRFNEGEGHTVTDLAGLGSGSAEYAAIGDECPEGDGWCEWETGWVEGAKDSGVAITPAD